MSWTDERVELLKKLHAEGLSCSQIAEQIGGVSRNAVIGKLHRMGLSGGRAQQSAPTKVAIFPTSRTVERAPTRARVYRPGGFTLPPLNRTGEPQLPRARANAKAFAPLPGFEPVPFASRGRLQCAWPVGGEGGDMMVCGCAVPDDGGPHYCPDHRAAARSRDIRAKSAKELIRELRRYAA